MKIVETGFLDSLHRNQEQYTEICPIDNTCEVSVQSGPCGATATHWLDEGQVWDDSVFHWHLCEFHFNLICHSSIKQIIDEIFPRQ
jgi:hypothetical protein